MTSNEPPKIEVIARRRTSPLLGGEDILTTVKNRFGDTVEVRRGVAPGGPRADQRGPGSAGDGPAQ